MQKTTDIIFVCSEICGGKTSLTQALLFAPGSNFVHIEVSDIVKDILKFQKRSDLQGHPEIDVKIIHRIKKIVEIQEGDDKLYTFLISGARQLSILQAFPEAQLIWINTTYKQRLQRFKERSLRSGENVTEEDFLAYNEKDSALGLDAVKSYIFNNK